MRKEWPKLFLLLLAPLVIVILYHCGFQPNGLRYTQPETKTVPSEKIKSITITKKPTGSMLADLPEGVEGCGPVWFTSAGEAFVWPWVEQRNGVLDRCDWKIKHVNGTWYARLVGKLDDGTITGYPDLQSAITLRDGTVEGAPVILDKHYTYFTKE